MAFLKYVSTLGTGFQKSTISNGGSGYTSGATSIVVADGSVFPSAGDFWVGVGNADPPDFIKICTARTGNTLTVASGVAAGTDGDKADGVAVQWVLPPEALEQLRADLMPTRATLWHDESTVTAGNAITRDLDASQAYYFGCRQNTEANGDTFTHSLVLAAGTYNFNVLGWTSSDRGLIDWYIDDVKVVSLQDWYAAVPARNVLKTESVSVSGNGRHVLKGVVNGKNGSSSSYIIVITKMWFAQASDVKSV